MLCVLVVVAGRACVAMQMQTRAKLPRTHTHTTTHPKQNNQRRVVEGTIRAQAFFILQDPWANAYNPSYRRTEAMSKYDRQLGACAVALCAVLCRAACCAVLCCAVLCAS